MDQLRQENLQKVNFIEKHRKSFKSFLPPASSQNIPSSTLPSRTLAPNTPNSVCLAMFSQQKFSQSYTKFLNQSTAYITIKEEHCPSELHERLECVEGNFEKIMQIIEIEKSNEFKLKQKITELQFSQVNGNIRRRKRIK